MAFAWPQCADLTVAPDGPASTPWNGRDAARHGVPSGIYLSRFEAGGEVAHGKLTLVR